MYIKTALLLSSALSIMLVAGCGGSDETEKSAVKKPEAQMTEAEKKAEKERRVFNPTDEERAADAAAREAAAKAKLPAVSQLPEPGPAPDFSAYKPIVMGTQLVFLHNALKNEPIDAMAIAQTYTYGITRYDIGDADLSAKLGSFLNTRDQFKKNDIAKEIEPMLQKHVDEYTQVRYVKIQMPLTSDMHKYDFEKKGFSYTPAAFNDIFTGTDSQANEAVRQGKSYDRGHIAFADNRTYVLAFSNGGEFNFVKVEDEAIARELEALIQKPGNKLSITVYGYVDSLQVGEKKKNDGKILTNIKIQRMDIADGPTPSKVIASVIN
ncbi:hypothetical protein OU997_03130 [Pseudomonas sp. SL4(2022)]|uniref:hypothetical protein n=1 Tax=Pseudomonas sp. SL4(2022) TaxID=2994661 RepID=UPI00226E91CB|nr:hypothetical protein [Pseudomonas sp. SL4(2022)]WAC45201.1 hypothetical protein OU997_03130 [Pseudomonas sp. SL4(2022)]